MYKTYISAKYFTKFLARTLSAYSNKLAQLQAKLTSRLATQSNSTSPSNTLLRYSLQNPTLFHNTPTFCQFNSSITLTYISTYCVFQA